MQPMKQLVKVLELLADPEHYLADLVHTEGSRAMTAV